MEPSSVMSARSLRKALMSDRGITMTAVAEAVDCSWLTVSNVVAGKNLHETPKTRRIKRFIAEKVGLSVAELWPEADDNGEARNPRAEPGANGAAG